MALSYCYDYSIITGTEYYSRYFGGILQMFRKCLDCEAKG